MQLGIQGKTALVAASSQGLGKAVAMSLAEEGARLVLCARNDVQLESTATEIRSKTGAAVHTVLADLSTKEGPQALVDGAKIWGGTIDILITNTGGPPPGTFEKLREEDWLGAFDLLLMSAVRLIRAALPQMTHPDGGRIVNITSVAVKAPIPGLMLSNALRSAVVGMAKTLAYELAPRKILVNNVCPGRIATQRLLELDRYSAAQRGVDETTIREEILRVIPLGRYGRPEELANLITFLASARASYITGATYVCDGGLYSGLM